ncbi:hypothetical protein B0H14DRAFT_2517202 [Mycena olivaceomarginata]|nr:hypothetical protein B0H14DRAFT_2517202 [Mycena olivaceomarginata]
MKRSRTQATQIAVSTAARKPKGIQACISCRKNKTRCELLDTTTSPIQCHRCRAIGVHCSYEETLVPAVQESPSPPVSSPIHSKPSVPPPSGFRPRPDPFPSVMPPETRVWQFVDENHHEFIDWSAPMLAIRNLVRPPSANSDLAGPLPSSSYPRETSLETILTPDQVQYLLEIFDHKYTPWINFKLIRQSNSFLLDTICCSIASRYMDCTSIDPSVNARLQGLAEDLIIKMIFNPRVSESIEAIQTLLILSLWEPIGGPENDERDGRVLLASAVSMAMNLRLNQASARAEALRKTAQMNGGYMVEEDSVALNEMSEHARLWVSLTNAESMLCLGTGRVPLSRRSPEDQRSVDFPQSFVGLTDYRNLRLGLVSMQATIAEEGVGLRINAPSEIDSWYDKLTSILESLKRGRRLLLPLAVTLDHEQFYFHILHIYDGICRLLVLYNAFWEARVAVGHVPFGEVWHHRFLPHGVQVVPEWGRDMIQTSEAILVYACQADVELLGRAPNVYFYMITLAAGYIVGVKFLMHRRPEGGVLLGGSDLLLARTATHFIRASSGPGHSAHKCALLINGMIAKWESRGTMEQRPVVPTNLTPPSSDADSSSSHYPNNSPLRAIPPELDFSAFLNTTTAMDAEFWKELQNPEFAIGYQ